MIKVGLIGYGFSAKTFHLPFIETSNQLKFTAISSSQPAAVREQYPDVAIYSSAEDLIGAGAVDLVVITTPNDVHYPIAKQCLMHGLHVILEKPMVTSSAEAAELAELAQSRSLILSVFQNRRWDGDFLTLEKLTAQNAVGDVRYFESHFDRFRPNVQQRWREQSGSGTGIWWDLGPHLVDQALCLFGKPEALTARCLSMREQAAVTDYFHVLLHYPNLEVVLHASPFAATPNIRFQLQGSEGSYVKYGLDPQEPQLISGMLPTDTSFGEEQAENFGTLYTADSHRKVKTETGCYQQYYANIVAAIEQGTEPVVNVQEAIQVIQILELAEISTHQKQTICLD